METIDDKNIDRKLGNAPLRSQWRPDLLGGVVTIDGQWADGSEFVAVPNYARMNRVGPPPAYPGNETDSVPKVDHKEPSIVSKVWV